VSLKPVSAKHKGIDNMKKIMNGVDDLLEQSLAGFALAHKDIVELHTGPYFVSRKSQNERSKVALVSGGGSGHEPLHTGFVGKGMLDAACPGHIFTSPTPDQMIAATEAVDRGKGTLFIVKNYAGDVMNFEIAAEMLDIETATVLVSDDISLSKDHTTGRRGVAGTTIIEKIVGAAAESGLSLAECKVLGDRVNQATASIGLALTSCTVPAIGKPTFELSDDEVEMGVGIHGERGRETIKIQRADMMINPLVEAIDSELQPKPGQKVLLHINGLGATPLVELYLIYKLAADYWQNKGVEISRSLVGNYTTSLDMAGASITLTLLDEELLAYWDAPVHTANLNW
jgi:dihydroxyacetone kinase-like protein